MENNNFSPTNKIPNNPKINPTSHFPNSNSLIPSPDKNLNPPDLNPYNLNSNSSFHNSENIHIYNSSSNNSPDRNLNLHQIHLFNFNKFLKDIKLGMSKCKYRKTLEDIISREEMFHDMEIFWKLKKYKIKCMLKILQKKMFNSEAPQNFKSKSIDLWTIKIESELESWIGNLNFLKTTENNEQYEQQIEILMHLFLEELYLQAEFKLFLKKQLEVLAILSLGERIVNIFCDFSRSAEFLQSAQKINLFISSMLISDNDFISAKLCQVNSINLSFKELFLRIDLEEGIFYDNLSKTNQHFLNKIFTNLIIAFYQRGVCDENLGNLHTAIESYKQAVWFSNKFIKFHNPEISQFLSDIEIKSKDYHKLIKKIIEKISTIEFKENSNKVENKNKIYSTKENEIIKNSNLENEANSKIKKILESIKHPEFEFIEDDKKSENIKAILSTVNLLNNFSSDKFKDLLKNLPNENLQTLDKNLIDKIQKILNDIRAEKIFSELNKKKKKLKNTKRIVESQNIKLELQNYFNKDSKNENNLNLEKNYNVSMNIFMNTENFLSEMNSFSTSPNSGVKKGKNVLSTNLNTDAKEINTGTGNSNKSRPMSYRSCKVLKDPAKKIEKYKHSEFIFSADFQKKLKSIDEMMRKETDFQKKLLHLKKYEKLPLELKEINHQNIKVDAENFFERVKSANKYGRRNMNETPVKKTQSLREIELNKKEKHKDKLEIAVIKSLDAKAFGLLDKFRKNEEKSETGMRVEFNYKMNEKNYSQKDSQKINMDCLKKIDKDISFLNKKEDICKKIIDTNEYTKKKNKYSENNFNKDSKNNICAESKNKINEDFCGVNKRPFTGKGKNHIFSKEDLFSCEKVKMNVDNFIELKEIKESNSNLRIINSNSKVFTTN